MSNASFYVSHDNTGTALSALDKQIAAGMEAIGLKAEGYAKKACPVDTGRLRASITHQLDVDGKTAYIGTNVEYAPYVELGTYKQKAQPYLVPAAQNHGSEYRSILKAYLSA